MRRGFLRMLAAAAILGFVLAGVSPGAAGTAVVQFPVFTGAIIFFVTSGFSVSPVSVLGFSTISPVIIQPVIIVRPGAFIAPTRVVVLSPFVPVAVPVFPLVPMFVPAIGPPLDPPETMPPVGMETVSNLARAPELYSLHVVRVAGVVSQLGTFVDERGHAYMFFRLQENWRSISVLVGGQAASLRDGLPVQVTGVFYSSAAAPEGWPSKVIQALTVTGTP